MSKSGSAKATTLLFATAVITVWLVSWSSTVQAGYAVLNGTPVTQGQLRISEGDFERLQVRDATAPDRLLLKETRVNAEVSGVLARVRVSQVFQNPYAERLEALYVFPLPDSSAVDGFSFQVGERIIVGEIKKREEARKAYEQARDEGRKAALLEQERPNLFSQAVANIPPGAEITVHIDYVHPLEIDNDRYVFRFPMVVGPRYIPGSPLDRPNVGRGWARDTTQVSDASRITPQHLAPGMRNGNDVFISVRLDAGMPIQEVLAVTHELDVKQTSETLAEVSLMNQSTIADKDFVLEYRLAGQDTVLATLTHRAENTTDGYLLLVLQPKWKVEPKEYAAREVVLVLDRSGSMDGPSISQLRIFAQHLLDSLKEQDEFRVIAFNNQAQAFQNNALPATAANIEAAKQFVRGLHSDGGTEMLAALEFALDRRSAESNRPRYLILMTDALVGDDDTILGYLQRSQFADYRVFPVAFGTAPNHYLMNRAAEIGRGFATQVHNQDNPTAIADRFTERTSTPYMTDLEIDWGKLVVKDMIPERLPDLYAGEPLVVMARYDTPRSGKVVLHGNVLGQAVGIDLQLELPERDDKHDSIGTLWARQQIGKIWNRDLGQATEQGREEITLLGLTHRLVTQFTSFVAVEKEIPEELKGTLRTETVPIMLPEGMTEKASGQPSRPITQNTASQARPYVPNYQAPSVSTPVYQPSSGGGGGGCGSIASIDMLLFLGLIYFGRRSTRVLFRQS
jgi:Ca-activated chloride channel family protein